jgi:hypothetical protein
MKNMQYFAKYDTSFDEEFLYEGYLYLANEDENLSINEFEALIKTKKDKKKNIAGTIFMYSPYAYPKGYNNLKSLTSQGFDFEQGFVEVEVERELTMLKHAFSGEYGGKIIEVRYLFNLNIENIDKEELLGQLNMDLHKLHSSQLTVFDRDLNYIDTHNLHINGKFVFFAWGHKISNKGAGAIKQYAQDIYDKCVQMQKKIAYTYRASMGKEYAIENIQFLHPIQSGRFKSNMPHTLKEIFKTNPPTVQVFKDKI